MPRLCIHSIFLSPPYPVPSSTILLHLLSWRSCLPISSILCTIFSILTKSLLSFIIQCWEILYFNKVCHLSTKYRSQNLLGCTTAAETLPSACVHAYLKHVRKQDGTLWDTNETNGGRKSFNFTFPVFPAFL